MREIREVIYEKVDGKEILLEERNYNLYTINQLEEPVREKVLDNRRYNYVECGFWHEFTIENFQENAKKIGYEFETNDVTFDLFGQGSHLSFKGSLDLFEFVKRKEFKIRLGLEETILDCLYCEISEYGKVNVGIHHYTNYDRIDFYLEQISEQLEYLIDDELHWLLKHWRIMLEDEYSYLTSDEFSKEELLDDNTWFTEKGEIWE